MLNSAEILQTINMFDRQHLDIRTITMGISLLYYAQTHANYSLKRNNNKK